MKCSMYKIPTSPNLAWPEKNIVGWFWQIVLLEIHTDKMTLIVFQNEIFQFFFTRVLNFQMSIKQAKLSKFRCFAEQQLK